MKPLPVAPHTEDDRIIWCELMRRLFKRHWAVSRESDRRDADMMLIAQRWPDMCCYSVAVGTGTMVRCCQRVRGEYAGWCGDRAVFDITKCV